MRTLAVLCLLAAPAFAQQSNLDTAATGDRPWAAGVPAEQQKAALELFRDGNASLKESLFVKAAQKYREALQLWDHPAIHYNLALALVNLDQPVETHEHLTAALKFGPKPLDADKYDQAQRYKALVEKQLARVEVRCDTEGAAVRLDGRALFTGPGRYEGLIRAGPHTVIASREGYLTNEQSRALPAGETTTFELKMLTTEDLTAYRRKFSNAIPWTVVGAGAVLVGGSVGLHLASRSAFSSYDRQIQSCSAASASGGCVPDATVAGARASGNTLQGLAIGGYVVGGAALVAGAVLVYVNRLQPYRTSVELPGSSTGTTLLLVPQASPLGAGASLLGTF